MQTNKLRIHFRNDHGPRLNEGLSKQIREGLFQKLGVGSLSVLVDAAGEWAPSTCLYCAGLVGSAILDDGEEVHFDLALDDEGQICAQAWAPHKCAPMIAAERYDDPDEVFRRGVEETEARD